MVAVAVVSALEAVAQGSGGDALLEDIDDKSAVVSEADSVASIIVPPVGDDYPSVFSGSSSTNDSVGATHGPLRGSIVLVAVMTTMTVWLSKLPTGLPASPLSTQWTTRAVFWMNCFLALL